MAELLRPSSRAPSQLGVKASFSRPSTRGSDDPVDRVSKSQGRCDTGLGREKSTVDGVAGGQGVLITELGYESDEGNNENGGQIVNGTAEQVIPETLPPEETKSEGSSKVKPAVNTPDIFNDQEWDTDLEDDEETTDLGPPFRGLYKSICGKHGCTPNSYFLKHLDEKEVRMKHHGFTKTESHALAEVLRSIICVDTLDLEDNWLRNVGCKQLCKMMQENDNIHEMNLSQNQLGIEAAIQIGNMLKTNQTLQSLSLAANAFEDNIAEILAEPLEDCRLRILRLSKNQFGDKTGHILGSVLAANDYIDTLDISWNMIRGNGASSLAKGLKENIRLRVLDLSWNGFGEKGGLAIADALLVNSTLTELDISANRLTNNVAVKFAKVIAASDALQILKMNDNPISTSGAVTLVTALLNNANSTIEHLGLDGNPVEYEFLRTVKELQASRKVTVTYGTILRSGNTTQDLGKPAIDECGPVKPVLIMEENLIINNRKRLRELFTKYYLTSTEKGMCNPEELIDCLKIMSPGLNTKQLSAVVQGIPRNHHNLIPLRNIFEPKDQRKTTSVN